MRTNVLSFLSSESIPVFLANVCETIGSKFGHSLNIQLNNRRPNGEVLIQVSLIPISKNNFQKLNEQYAVGLICPLRSDFLLVSY